MPDLRSLPLRFVPPPCRSKPDSSRDARCRSCCFPKSGNCFVVDFLARRKVTRVDFIVAGVQKAGTTAVHDFLAQHPHIALLRDQALHFFDKEENFSSSQTGPFEPDYSILHSNFDPGWRWRIAGEVTADYVYYP